MKSIIRIIGTVEACVGGFLVAYVLLWLIGLIYWSADVAFAIMAAGGAFLLADGISRVRRKKSVIHVKNRAINSIAQGMIGITALLVAVIQILILSGLGDKTPVKSDYAVIFGAKIYGSTPSLLLNSRIGAAAAYLNEYPDALAIACGGFTDGGEASEAQVIKNGLIARGIDERRILLDERSADSRQSAWNAYELMRAHGLGSVTVVTSDYHLYRCMRMFKRLDLTVNGYGSGLILPLRPIAHFREMLSLIRDFVVDFAGYSVF